MDPRLSLPSEILEELVSTLRASLLPPPPPQSASASPIALPAAYAGDSAECGSFLLQLALYIEMQPQKFPTERSKVAFLISLLSGRALSWARAIWNANTSLINSYDAFTNNFKEVFELATGALSVSDQLLRLRQGTSSTHEYTLQFRTLAATSGWNEAALLGAYRQGLDPSIRAQIAIFDDSVGLESFMLKANRIAQRLSACQTAEAAHQPASPANGSPVPEPMQVDTARLSSQERARRMAAGLCLYCALADHFIRSCPNKTPRPAVSTLQIDPVISTLSVLTVQLFTPVQSVTASALVDSGSSGNFISQDLVSRLPHRRHAQELRVETINGKPLGRGCVKFESPPMPACPMKLKIGNLHEEEIKFLVLGGPTVDIILGCPWLILHSPEIKWESSEIIRWSEFCHQNCLKEIPHPLRRLPAAQVASMRVESPEASVIPTIPFDYRAFQDVFSKQAATQLPPHRAWDCAIDLLPGYKLAKGRVYSLSIPECKAMEEYIKEALNQGYIRPSSSPAASSFFFVSKKDGGLRPCIDYRALNSQTIKLPYPLPLVPAVLEELRGARIFSKLDLRSAYNLIRIREGNEWKTAFITPSDHYEYLVMPYGLSNAPSVFQEFMNEVFREFLHRFVIVYIDDILIYSQNLADHRHHVAQVLQKLRQFRLYLKLEKCEFHRPTVQFLGYIIGREGIQMDQGKVTAVAEWPTPQTIKDLQRFLGFANFYRRFMKGFSLLTAPLATLLCGKPKSLSWSSNAHEAFNSLKTAFSTAPILRHPDPHVPFVVKVDASTTGAGAVLSQLFGEPPHLQPCAYYSKKLTSAEQNDDIGNRELLAIKLALEEWRHWLEGANHPFTVITDPIPPASEEAQPQTNPLGFVLYQIRFYHHIPTWKPKL